MEAKKILELIRLKGPVIPSQLNKELNSSILIASATLGELASKNLLNISYLKIGGSPLYYMAGQEEKLQHFSDKLHEKEKRAYDLLKQKKVLRDKELTPVTRVALRQIKDFAKPLQVRINEDLELFWKWYLIPNQEAEALIKKILEASKPEVVKKVEEPKIRKGIKKEAKDGEFSIKINRYFASNNIQIIEQRVLRKNSEIDYVIRVPSAVGSLTYFCKAKSKKRVNDGDLGSAYVQGQAKKLPVLFLTLGNLTKKAQSMLEKEFKGMRVKQI